LEGQHAASEPHFAQLLHTKLFVEISDYRVIALLGGWVAPSQCAEKLMIVLQNYNYAQQLCVL
jgi:hypothetical protein